MQYGQKIKRNKIRSRNKEAKKHRKHVSMVHNAKKFIYNLTNIVLTDEQYLMLGKGLKYIPQPKSSNIKQSILRSFDEFARKVRCRYHFHNPGDNIIHPFRSKSQFTPHYTCHEQNSIYQICN